MARFEVITGPMFSGKSEELIRRLNRALHADKKILAIKPRRDTRTKEEIAARRKRSKEDKEFVTFQKLDAHTVNSFIEIVELVNKHRPNVLALDEAQFFLDYWIVECVQELLDMNEKIDFTIILSGLDTDYLRKPFGQMPNLMAMADSVLKLSAICFKCKGEGILTWRKPGSPTEQVLVGDTDIYEARCRSCHKLSE